MDAPQNLLALIAPRVRDIGISEVARRAGFSRPGLSAIVNGEKSCTVETYARLCTACGVEVAIKATKEKR